MSVREGTGGGAGSGGNGDGTKEQVREILESGAAGAARLIVATVKSRKMKQSERYGAALEILNRLYGKASAAAPEEAGQAFEIRFSPEAERYAK